MPDRPRPPCLRLKSLYVINRCFWLFIVVAVLVRGFWVNITSNLTFNAPWTVGEWLINYAGGFVRRGLPGTVIYHSSTFFGCSPWLIAVFASIISWLILAAFLWLQCRHRFRALFIFSPFAMLSPLIGEYLIRKDCFNLAVLAFSLLIAKPIPLAGYRSRAIRLLLVNALGIVAVLSHESYVFYAIPSLFCVIQGLPEGRVLKRSLGPMFRLSLMFAPMLAVAGLCLFFHGDARISEAIQSSWLRLSDRYPSVYFSEPVGAIDAVGWSFAYGLSYTNNEILFELANGFIWRPIALLVTLLLSILLVASPFALRDGKHCHLDRRVATIFGINLVFMLPVFVVGHDYGRWLFMINVATVLVSSSIEQEAVFRSPLFSSNRANLLFLKASAAFVTLLSLFFGIPPYWNSWNLVWSAQCSWLGYLACWLSTSLHVRFSGVYILLFALLAISCMWLHLPNLYLRRPMS